MVIEQGQTGANFAIPAQHDFPLFGKRTAGSGISHDPINDDVMYLICLIPWLGRSGLPARSPAALIALADRESPGPYLQKTLPDW